MEVFKIDIRSWTASFRYPNLISGVQPTLEVPPLSTILGLINAAAGSYVNHQKFKIGYYFQYGAKATDLETIYQVDKNRRDAKSNVIRREFLFDAFLRLYVEDEQIVNYFRQPYYPLVLGRMNDLASVDNRSIKKIQLQEVATDVNIKGQIVPLLKYRLPGVVQALPTYFTDTIPRQNLGTQPFSIINHNSNIVGQLTAFRDEELNVDVFFHDLDFSVYD
ncbi:MULTISPECIES: type I-B CRISPR-associated protein Cas5b [Xanthocytophaga]|uniref:Type I-B CRISPR-associated protein Cas5b n=2 Tax=Xanthocytophaga TaxID=3078918 RepID=A0AAE3QUI8_9BACT|nr:MULTISPECIES: type I-B CRISPR-associated protein Cas5b [Xanthocytophaga]MDJ1485730.1 type I-B CRISPR-associated protein Cas5b [Xanthocytophaga flavus]MDJ1500206.1 type I-B CRISPR-associated protein Cas5b [Xanthocytophaga agilis]